MRPEMTGLALRHPLVLAFVTIDTEQQTMFGRGLLKLFPLLNVATGAVLRPQIIHIDHLQRRMRLVTHTTVPVLLTGQVRLMAAQAVEKLAVLLMTGLAVEY